jgi:hypothetical protein
MRTMSDVGWLLRRLGSSRWDMYRSGRCSSREASARISSVKPCGDRSRFAKSSGHGAAYFRGGLTAAMRRYISWPWSWRPVGRQASPLGSRSFSAEEFVRTRCVDLQGRILNEHETTTG